MHQRKGKNQIFKVRNFALHEYVTAFCRIQMALNLTELAGYRVNGMPDCHSVGPVKNSTQSFNNTIMTQ